MQRTKSSIGEVVRVARRHPRTGMIALVAAAVLSLACTPQQHEQSPPKTAAAEQVVVVAPPCASAQVAAAPEFPPPLDRRATVAAMNSAAAEAAACGDGMLAGSGSVSVTFEPSGRASTAVSGADAPWLGASIGSCVLAAMRRASVPPFSGNRVTVIKTVQIR